MRKRKKKTNNKLILAILIISLFICIGYAEITNTNINITGILDAIAQKEVFISDVTTTDASSIINRYTGTVLDTKTVLGSSTTSVVSYNITLYNNSEKDYIFIGVVKDDDLYSNTNITYTLSGLKEYETTIYPQSSLTFTITFKYAGTNVSNNILESKLNFRFREKPEISLSNAGKVFALENIYPGYTPEEYKFKVTNKNEATGKTNGVSMKYTFETTIDAPLKAEIYDGTTLVTGSVDLKGEKEYTLKIVWDESSNSESYANKEYTCNVKLKAVPTNADYAEYNITKEFNINIKTAPFYFNAELGAESVKLEEEEVSLGVTLKNNNLSAEYNIFDTNYEIYFEETSKFSLNLEDTNSGVIASGANTNNVTAKISLKEGQTLETAETANIIIKATKPYAKEISKTITIEPVERISIKDLTAGTYVNYVDNDGNKIPCIILYDTAYNAAKGTNYGVQVITASPVKDVTIGSSNFEEARVEYNSAIETLNSEAMTYLNTNYATDARCVGSNPADKNAEGEEVEYESCGIFKSGDENYVIDDTRRSELGITTLVDAWFASRSVTIKMGEPRFSMRYCGAATKRICYVELGNLNCTSVTADLHPVFKLKTNIYTNGGEGTAKSPYNLIEGEPVVESVTITGESTVNIAGTIQLTAETSPAEAVAKTITWTSSNPGIATVDEKTGLVTGVTPGNVTITVNVDGVTATYDVTVSNLVSFFIWDAEFTAEYGMTWNEWVNTDYNDWGVEIYEPIVTGLDKTVISPGSWSVMMYDDETTWVDISDEIIAGHVYIDVGIPELGGNFDKPIIFTVNGAVFTAYEGTYWGALFGNSAILCPECGSNISPSTLQCNDCMTELVLTDELGNEIPVYSAIEEGNYFLQKIGEEEITFTITSETGKSTVKEGETLQLTATILPKNLEGARVVFISNAGYIADVDQSGLVIGEAPGTTYIIAYLCIDDGEYIEEDTFEITVEGEAVLERRRYRKFSLYDI